MNSESQPLEAQDTPNAKKIAFKSGLLWAFINIVLFLLVYYIQPSLLGNFSYGIVSSLISIGLAIYFVLDLRKQLGGYWTFRDALGNIFVLFFVQYLVYYLFTIAFPRFIEPGYTDRIRDIRLNSITEIAERFGGDDQDQIDQMIEQAELALETELNPGFADVLQTMAISVIVYFIFALIFAAIFKRERPMFHTIATEE